MTTVYSGQGIVFQLFLTNGIVAALEAHDLTPAVVMPHVRAQQESITTKGYKRGEDGNYFVVTQLEELESLPKGSRTIWLIVDDYGELGLDGEPNPGTHTFVQTVLFPEEY